LITVLGWENIGVMIYKAADRFSDNLGVRSQRTSHNMSAPVRSATGVASQMPSREERVVLEFHIPRGSSPQVRSGVMSDLLAGFWVLVNLGRSDILPLY
jgi:hypothetical protein